MEHGRQPGAHPEPKHHVAELRHRRVGQHLLDVVLHEGQRRGDDDRDSPDHGDQVHVRAADIEAGVEDRVQPGHQEDASDHHRRGVQQRRHRGRSGHRVGEPGVERELARLANAGNKQRHRAPEEHAGGGLTRHRPTGDRLDREAVGTILDRPLVRAEEDHGGADEQPHVAHPDGEEGLQRCARVRLLLPPVTDEHERAETHDLPAENQLDHVLGQDHDEHARREQGQRREEVRIPTITSDVLGREDLHEERDERDEQQQHHGEAVDVLTKAELEAPRLPPGPRPDHGLHIRLATVATLGGRREHASGEPEHPAKRVLSGALVDRTDPLDPLHRGSDRNCEREGHRGDAHLAATLRQAPAEADDDREADRRDQRNEEGVLKEPAR